MENSYNYWFVYLLIPYTDGEIKAIKTYEQCAGRDGIRVKWQHLRFSNDNENYRFQEIGVFNDDDRGTHEADIVKRYAEIAALGTRTTMRFMWDKPKKEAE